MLTIFYRRFYVLLFLIWLAAAAGLFVLSVWGNFDTFVNDFSSIVRMGADNATNGTLVKEGNATVVQEIEKAGESIRREVVHEVRTLEKEVKEVFRGNASTPTPDPVAQEIKRDLAANRTRVRIQNRNVSDGFGLLTKIDFTHTPEQFLARLSTSQEVGRVTYFWLEKPAKLVVDLRGKWRYSTRRVTDFIDGFVKQVVLGRHPDRLRLVFIFTDSNALKGKAPELIKTPEGLDIVVGSPPKERKTQSNDQAAY